MKSDDAANGLCDPSTPRESRTDRRSVLIAAAAALACSPLRAGSAANAAIRFGLTPVFMTDDLKLLHQFKLYLEEACSAPV